MRSSLFVAFVAASALAIAGCGSSSGGGSGGSGGNSGGSAGGSTGGVAGGSGGSTGTGGATGGSGGATGGHAGGGGQGGGGQGGGIATDCNPACTGQTACVGTGVEGGPLLLVGDGGTCPQGRHPVGSVCVQDLTYACMAIPTACGGTATCACASATLCVSGHTCLQVNSNELTCVLEAP